MAVPSPVLWFIAGPNGVGKTTYARAHIRAVTGSWEFVNIDLIARGLSPFAPEPDAAAAARMALRRIDDHLKRPPNGTGSFTIETTLSGRTHLRTVARAKAAGFRVHLLFFAVAQVETCLQRIARRVAEGGHDMPEVDVRRRFPRSVHNFTAYAAACDLWRVFDGNASPRVVADGSGAGLTWRGDLSGLPDALQAALAEGGPGA
jgi:predicted ABC-type ATPase